MEKLHRFLSGRVLGYRASRNYDRGPGKHDAVSGLSPYIRYRLLLEPEVLTRTLDEHELGKVGKFVDEVFWRTYWKGWLEHNPAVWSRYLRSLEEAQDSLHSNPALRAAYFDAVNGKTGITPFDAWVEELCDTGYVHNHARMWFASIWIFTLKLPWVLGADFFLRHLLDGDCASNTLSWRWVAGLQTKGKTYLTTVNNLRKYAEARFFNGSEVSGLDRLASSAVPLQEPPLPPASPLVLPSVAEPRAGEGLLLTEEDLWFDRLIEPGAVSIWRPEANTVAACSPTVQGFKDAACGDALARCANEWPNTAICGSLTSVSQVVDWVRTNQLQRVHMAYVAQGLVRPSLAPLNRALAECGCELSLFVRTYDRQCWPHCRRGFFQLRKRIPSLIEQMGLDRGMPRQASLFFAPTNVPAE
jgi:deoxyribodipyrimidine photo-lyase